MWANLTISMDTISPAVLTSTAADNHLNTVVKPAVNDANAGLQANAAKTVANTPSPTTSSTTTAPSTSTSAPLNTYNYIANDGTQKTIQGATPQAAMAAAPDIAPHSGVQAVPTPVSPEQTTTPTDTSTTTPTSPTATEDKALADAQADYQKQANQVRDTILNIQNGTIPLNPGEQAQVAGLQQQFQALIDAQKLTNIGATGTANIRGYQTGSAEYDPSFQVKTIGAIVTAGYQKVADLGVQEASAVAKLTQSLKDGDIAAVKDAWTVYQDASKNRTDALQKTIDATNKAIKDAQDAQQKQVDAINTVATELAKNGAPADVIAKATSAGSVADAIQAGAGYFQDPTSAGGQYSAYVAATKAEGLTPMSAGDFLAKQKADEAYATAKSTAAGKAAGTPSSGSGGSGGSGGTAATTGIVQTDAQAVLEGRNTLYNIRQTMGRSNSAAAYMQNLRSLITAQDPNFDFVASDAGGKSVSTSYVQKATAAIDTVLPNIAKVVDLSNQVNRVGVTGVDKLLQAGAVTINNQKVANFHEAQKLIADEIGIALGAGTVSDMKLQLGFDITDPSVSPEVFASNMGLVQTFLQNRQAGLNDLRYKSSTTGDGSSTVGGTGTVDPKTAVDEYVIANPAKAETIAKLYDVPGTTDQDVLDYINLLPK